MMRFGDIVWFSRDYDYSDLSWLDDEERCLNAFEDRTKWIFLEPAEEICEKHPFATGILCVCAIDYLVRLPKKEETHASDYRNWLKDNILELGGSEFDFYDIFRCGLVHEGRVKKGFQFSLEIDSLLSKIEGVLVINPRLLLKEVTHYFNKYLKELRTDDTEFSNFREGLRNLICKDLPNEISRE